MPMAPKASDGGSKAPAKRAVARPEGTTPLNINLPSELVEGLHAWVEAINAKGSGPRWTKTDVVRTLLMKGIERHAKKGETP